MEQITVVSRLDENGKRIRSDRSGSVKSVPGPLNEQEMRRLAIDYMVKMASIKWTSPLKFDYSFNNKLLVYEPGCSYYGMVYNNNQNGYEAFMDALDENGVYKLTDTNWNTAPGNSCATSMRHAWQLVSPTVDFSYSIDMMPVGRGKGLIPVGNVRWDLYDGKNTTKSVQAGTPEEDLLEAYAEAKPGDGMVRYLDTGGHALMVTKEPLVKRNRSGKIIKEESFMYLTEQNNLLNNKRDLLSSWKIDYPVGFEKALECGWLPVSVLEFREGTADAPYVRLYGAPTEASLSAGIGLTGKVRSNYCFVTVKATLTKAGKEIASFKSHPYRKEFALKGLGADHALQNLSKGKYKLTLSAQAGAFEFQPVTVTFTV